jgi:HlyD family secretion protein
VSRKWLFAGLGLIVLAGAGIALARRERRPSAKRVVAKTQSAPAEANFVGTVRPRTSIAVPAPSAGVLDAFFVDVGQEVYEGQLLGRLRNDPVDDPQKKAQASLDQAQERATNLNSELLAAKLEVSRASADQMHARSEIDHLEKEYTRQKKFWDRGITPRLTYEKAEKDYLSAKSDLDSQDAASSRAKDRLADLTAQLETTNRAIAQSNDSLEQAKSQTAGAELHSPTDGLVVARRGQPGDTVDPSVQDLFKIAKDLTSLEVDASPDPEILGRMHAGQPVSVRVPELSPEEIPGVVRELHGPQIVIDFTSPTPLPKLDLPAQVKISVVEIWGQPACFLVNPRSAPFGLTRCSNPVTIPV